MLSPLYLYNSLVSRVLFGFHWILWSVVRYYFKKVLSSNTHFRKYSSRDPNYNQITKDSEVLGGKFYTFFFVKSSYRK